MPNSPMNNGDVAVQFTLRGVPSSKLRVHCRVARLCVEVPFRSLTLRHGGLAERIAIVVFNV